MVSYVTGGGIDGNVPAEAIRELRSSVGFVKSAANPLPATGGAGAESLRAARDRGSAGRAPSRSRGHRAGLRVARVRGIVGSRAGARAAARGARRPRQPRLRRHRAGAALAGTESAAVGSNLRSTVLQFLARRVPAGIAGGMRIVAPSYVAVGVRADLLPVSAEEAATVEARVRTSLVRFLHPLTGGLDGHGWDFGRSVYLSDVAARLASVEGVAAVELLQLRVGQVICGDSVAIEPHQLVCAGELQLKIVVPSVPYALA